MLKYTFALLLLIVLSESSSAQCSGGLDSCYVLPLSFYVDTNGNCAREPGEQPVMLPILVQIDSNGTNVGTRSTTSGMKLPLKAPIGTVYTFSIVPGSGYVSCAGPIHDTVISTTSGSYLPVKEVPISCPSSASSVDLTAAAVVVATGVQDQSGHIYVWNCYCTPTNANLTFNHSPKYNASPMTSITPTSTSGNTINWNMPAVTFANGIRDHYYVLWAPSGSLLTVGDTVQQHIVINPVSGADVNTANNTVVRVDTVKAGVDPNYIQVDPPGCFEIPVQQLRYTIHFENTGNDTAHNIYVEQQLSNNLDPASLRLVMASHQMNISQYRESGHNMVKFDFPNIKLLDSSHHGLCDGVVIYTINTKPGLATGATIEAGADIYFDINPAVVTNTVQNVKGCPTRVEDLPSGKHTPALYPNPVNDELFVKADQDVFTSFTITNSIGQKIIQKQISDVQTHVNVKALPAGIYYVVFSGAQGREVVKFVKE